ncbi:hypothetical protein ACVWZR_005306 [Bradyrhizobium sp. i1.3.1]
MNSDQARLTHAHLRTPRAAAVAGILFSVLLFAVFWLMRLSIPGDPFEPGAWLEGSLTYVTLAMNLVPFAGVAFLWFIGVLRDRLGAREDQFFATVFLGSGLLLLAMLFAAAAAFGAIITAFHAAPGALENSPTFHFGRGLAYGMINIYLIQDSYRLHVYDVHHRPLHTFDASLARTWGIRRSDHTPHRELLSRLEPAGIPALGPVDQPIHSVGEGGGTEFVVRSSLHEVMS